MYVISFLICYFLTLFLIKMDFSQYLQVIISLATQHLSLHEGNAIAIIATGDNQSYPHVWSYTDSALLYTDTADFSLCSSFLYPSETCASLVTTPSPSSIALFRSQLVAQLSATVSSMSPLLPPAHYSLAGALIRALLCTPLTFWYTVFIVLSNLYTLRSKSFTSLVTYFVVFFSLSCPVFSLRLRTRCIS